MAGHGHRVQTARREVDRDLTDGLDRVGVHRDAVRTRELDDLLDGLQRPDLVVGPHDGDQRDLLGVLGDLGTQRGEVHAALAVDGQQDDLGARVLGHPERGVEHRVVLDRRDDDPPTARVGRAAAPEQALDREVVRLGAPAVNTTSLGRAPSAAAIDSRASSTVRRAARPAACSDDGLPVRDSSSTRASRAATDSGVVAAWSR